MESQQFLLTVILILSFVFVFIYKNSLSYGKEPLQVFLNDKLNQNKFKIPYEDLESDYYSLYGWRTNPPYEYPQKTINTPFNLESRECSPMCNNKKNARECLENCRHKALTVAINNSKFFPSQEKISEDPSTVNIENFSNVNRSLPSHTSPMYRSIKDETKPFCFYR